jgi:hypothetical protein
MMKQMIEPHPRIVERDALRYAADDPSAGSHIEAIMALISAQVTANAQMRGEPCSNVISESTRQAATGVVRYRGS